MLVSFVILNWNRPEDTELATDSVLRQQGEIEVIIWDNASSDGSPDRLRARYGREARVRILLGDANYGVAGGRNRAFREARGGIIFSLDSDAVLEGDQVANIVRHRFSEDGRIGAVSFEVKRPDGHLMWPFARPSTAWRAKSFDTIRVDGCAFAASREAFEKVGGFAEHYSPYGAEDQHFAFKLIGAGFRVVYDPSVVVIHAFTPRGRNPKQFMMHVRNMIWTPLELFPFPHSILRAARQALQLFLEGLEQKQVGAYFRGLAQVPGGVRLFGGHRMSRAAWRQLRGLIEDDKHHARS